MGHRFDSPQELVFATINITQQLSIKWYMYRDVCRQWFLCPGVSNIQENILKKNNAVRV